MCLWNDIYIYINIYMYTTAETRDLPHYSSPAGEYHVVHTEGCFICLWQQHHRQLRHTNLKINTYSKIARHPPNKRAISVAARSLFERVARCIHKASMHPPRCCPLPLSLDMRNSHFLNLLDPGLLLTTHSQNAPIIHPYTCP